MFFIGVFERSEEWRNERRSLDIARMKQQSCWMSLRANSFDYLNKRPIYIYKERPKNRIPTQLKTKFCPQMSKVQTEIDNA